jgi:hypothetical protein
MIRIYRVVSADRTETGYIRDRGRNFRGPKPDEHGNITLGKGMYRVDPNKQTRTMRKPFIRWKDATVQYYREGNPEPMDPLDFAAVSTYESTTLQRFADATFISQLWSEGIDMKTMLLMAAVVANLVLGGIIYSILK